MKKTITIIILLLAVTSIQAQSKRDHREKIKALKVAFITQELNMTPKTAQKFWPVYNQYEQEKRELHRRENVDWDNIGTISEEKAEEMIKEYLAVEREEYVIKKKLFSDLGKFLTAKEIIKLHQLESDFNKKIIKEYRHRVTGRN